MECTPDGVVVDLRAYGCWNGAEWRSAPGVPSAPPSWSEGWYIINWHNSKAEYKSASYPGGIRSWWDHFWELDIVFLPAFSYEDFFQNFSGLPSGARFGTHSNLHENSKPGVWNSHLSLVVLGVSLGWRMEELLLYQLRRLVSLDCCATCSQTKSGRWPVYSNQVCDVWSCTQGRNEKLS